MPQPTPKFRNQGESRHWTANQAAALNRFNWPAKRKANVEFAVELASQVADQALRQYRRRVKS